MDYSFLVDFDELYNFLLKTDTLFPIPLSKKIDLKVFAEKILKSGNVICCRENEIVGIVCFYNNDALTKIGYISVVGVLPGFQGKGIAKQLLKKAIELCERSGMETVTLYTHSTNTVAVKMYQSLGFFEVPSDRDGDIKFSLKI